MPAPKSLPNAVHFVEHLARLPASNVGNSLLLDFWPASLSVCPGIDAGSRCEPADVTTFDEQPDLARDAAAGWFLRPSAHPCCRGARPLLRPLLRYFLQPAGIFHLRATRTAFCDGFSAGASCIIQQTRFDP